MNQIVPSMLVLGFPPLIGNAGYLWRGKLAAK